MVRNQFSQFTAEISERAEVINVQKKSKLINQPYGILAIQ